MGNSIVLLGGDARLRAAAAGFRELHFSVTDLPKASADDSALLSVLADAELVVLPVPAFDGACISGTQLSIPQLMEHIPQGCRLYGGRVPPALLSVMVDYSTLPSFQAANAIPSAEGAIQILMEQLPITLHGARGLVIGYGRIGKALSTRLSALGMDVSVSARKEADLAAIQTAGFRAQHTGIYESGLAYDCIINTVPAPVFDGAQVASTKSDCFLLDLASSPGGIDFDACRRLERRFLHALGLPGKVAPVTSGLIIRDTILDHLKLQ